MTEKIEWYREVLALEPNSKIFFPLARMLEREGELAQACEVLKEGVRRHGEFLEARLFLVELLERLGRRDECAAEVEVLAGMLARYEGFWSAWSASAGRAGQDPALFVRMLGLSLKQPDLTVAELLRRGLDSFGQGQGKAWDQPGAVQPGAVQTGAVQPGAAQPEAIRSGAVQPEAAQPEAPRPASSEPALPASEAAGAAPSLSEASAADASGTLQTPAPFRAASRLAAEEAPAEGQRLPAAEAEAMPEETSAGASCAEPAEAKPEPAETKPEAAEAEVAPGKAEAAAAEAEPESAEAEPAPGKAGGASLKPAAKRPVQAPKAGGASLRTRSMAEVLAEQGDLASAAEIYDELALAAPEGERDVLFRRRDELKALQAAQPQAPGRAAESAEGAASSTRKILNLLETLAVRVEARANS